MRIVKIFSGVILCVCAFGFTIATEQLESKVQPYFIVLAILCVVGAVLLFRKTKKEKAAKQAGVSVQTEYTPDAVPADVAQDMRQHYTIMQAKRDMEIMADSFKLASTTKSIDVFCMRYDLALQKAHTLLQAEQVGVRGMKKLKCRNDCTAIINAAHGLKVRFLQDFAKDQAYQADFLKTEKGRYNRYVKMLLALQKAEPTFMLMEEYDALVENIKDRISQLSPEHASK